MFVIDVQSHVQAVIDAFSRGEIVVVTDDNDRENEGDLVLAAAHATPEKMAFIVRHTCGIVCAPLTADRARRLNLAPMVADNEAPHSTAFTVSVDYRHGTTTGISAEDRTATVRNLANGNAGPADFARPGHIFPLIAKEGGVLMRSGHTEAAIDLCRYAKLEPVGVICELVKDDGTVMRGTEIAAFAERHNLKRISVADLIAYRQAREKLVERVGEFPLISEVGPLQGYAYVTPFDKVHHMAFVYGRIGDGLAVPARLHRANVVGDVFGGARLIRAALQRFKSESRGVLVYLRDGTAGVPTVTISADGETHSEAARHRQWREIGLGAQILRDLGISSIRLLSSAQFTYVGLGGFGIEIESTEPLEG
ncbi:MAG TPA: 3,4-dihydroxy-2-butanone-4-phosphate synthase [Xanthobacteraceae bacterium]|nr:3,4-dihydroxy-2-butanone-4-phosphate synthase [Xanthobacteraceae bacterium]